MQSRKQKNNVREVHFRINDELPFKLDRSIIFIKQMIKESRKESGYSWKFEHSATQAFKIDNPNERILDMLIFGSHLIIRCAERDYWLPIERFKS